MTNSHDFYGVSTVGTKRFSLISLLGMKWNGFHFHPETDIKISNAGDDRSFNEPYHYRVILIQDKKVVYLPIYKNLDK